MAYEKKDYDFVLFINEGIQKNQPVVSGSIHIGGQEIPIVGWNRVSKNGKKMIVGSMAKKYDKKPEPTEDAFIADEIPF